MLRPDHILLGQQHRPLEHVLKLADVAGPVVGQEPVLCLGVHRDRLAAVPDRERTEEVVEQQRDVLRRSRSGGRSKVTTLSR